MTLSVTSPYVKKNLPWVRGNLHAHTTMSDGERLPQALVDEYAARGYGFLMISDHDQITDTSRLQAYGMTLIAGNEVTAMGPHTLHVAARTVVRPNPDRQQVIDAIVSDGGFAIMAHPNWEKHFEHCPQSELERLQGYAGIEIFNGVVRGHEGSPVATDRWDRLLGMGRRVWGFANDDAHFVGDEGAAWNVVQAENLDEETIVSALRNGRFYASTGVRIERIRVAGTTIHIETRDAQRIAVFGDFAQRLAAADGPSITYTVPADRPLRYVRFECYGFGDEVAWTQPFFVEAGNRS